MHAVRLVAPLAAITLSLGTPNDVHRDRASPEIVRTEIIIGQLLCLHRCGNGSQPCFAHVLDHAAIPACEHMSADVWNLRLLAAQLFQHLP